MTTWCSLASTARAQAPASSLGARSPRPQLLATSDGTSWALQATRARAGLVTVNCKSTTCRAVGEGGTILALHGVPSQPAGRGFGITAGPLPVLDSAMLSWTVGTQQAGYDILRFAA